MTTHLQARAILVQAWGIVLAHRDRTPMATQCVQAMICLETGYGAWPAGPMFNSNNYGAIQSTAKPLPDGSAPPGTAWATDTHPTSTGGAIRYRQLFRTYPTPLDGCADVLRWLAHRFDVLDAADTGIALVFSRALHDEHYFEGAGATEDERIHNHATGIYRNATIIAKSCAEPLCLAMGEPA